MSLRRLQMLRMDAPDADEDVWATSGEELFRRFSCIECGHIERTWAGFLAHRAQHHAGTLLVRRRERGAAA